MVVVIPPFRITMSPSGPCHVPSASPPPPHGCAPWWRAPPPPAWLQEAGNGLSVSQTHHSPECPPTHTHQESLPNHQPLLQTLLKVGRTMRGVGGLIEL